MRLSPKKNLLMIMRNYILLYLSSRQTLLGFWQSLLCIENNHIFQIMFKYGFRSTFVKKTLDVLKFTSYPVGSSFVNTLKYWLLKNNLQLLALDNRTGCFTKLPDLITGKQYLLGTPYILTRSTSRTFKILFTKLLLFTPFTWVNWSRKTRISYQHTFLQRNFYLFRFLNVYYCKVFSF